jgi:serine phosphatase RsbU (regulator of sigma subunit)/anti-sigma regulatory factor (Ser/Thr protein kinase)
MFLAEGSSYPSVQETCENILIIDGDHESNHALANYLDLQGYKVATAESAEDVLTIYSKFKPDLVIIEVISDSNDGFILAEKLKKLSNGNYFPILFLTHLNSNEVQVKCLQHGAVDVLFKPCENTFLLAKIKAHLRMRQLEKQNAAQQHEIESYNKSLKSSYDVAIDVFEKVIHSDVLDDPGVKYSISPISIFNGDILLAAYRPSGELQIMLGDFTGHGLSAAIGTIPVADIFYGMTAKGFGIADIINEVNQKVMKILPRGLFLAACLLEYDLNSRKLSIWNAGLPDILLYDKKDGEVTHQFKSRNYPLGVSEQVSFSTTVENYFTSSSERLVMFTDGIIEARNQQGNIYGIERVIEGIINTDKKWVLDKIIENLTRYTQGKRQSDDTTVLEICFDGLSGQPEETNKHKICTPIYDSCWQLDYTFESNILKVYDPVPNIIQMIMEIQKLHCNKQDIFIVIKELFVNAFDHGLLQLNSDIKNGQDGFSKYVVERQKRMAELTTGKISVIIEHTGENDGGVLDVTITDTGKGFDTCLIRDLLTNNSQYHSRGIYMVNSICETLKYNEQGNQVYARYRWQTTDAQ